MRVTDAQIWALYKVFGDTAAVTDLVIRASQVHADSGSLTDASSERDQSLVGHCRAFGFSITGIPAGRVSQPASITDSVSLSSAFARSFSDTAGISDSMLASSFVRSFSETVGVADSVSDNLQTPNVESPRQPWSN